MSGVVRHEGDRVWVEGVEAMEAMATNETTPNTTMAAFALALQTAGESISYEYLMGVSGSAFRFQLAEGWCVAATISHCGYETETNALAAIPYDVVELASEEEDADGVSATRRAVVASIDRGIPVVYRIMEDGLIVGYQKGGEEFLCVHPQERFVPRGIFTEERWPWCAFILGDDKTPAPDPWECAEKALQLAVELFHKEKEHDRPLCGARAWTTWIEELRDDALFVDNARWLENWWLYLSLLSARKCAASYLQTVAEQSPRAVSDGLRRAAELYGTMAVEVLAAPSPEVAPCPLKPNRAYAPRWPKECRLRQADILTDALDLERKAIAEIERALAVAA